MKGGGPKEKSSSYFHFDSGEVEFQGEKAVVKGSLLFDFVHEFREPNFSAVQEISVQLEQWLEDHLRGSPDVLETFRPLLKLNSHALAYVTPSAYTQNKDDVINMRKGFWASFFYVILWFTDDLDDDEKYQKSPHFSSMCKFFSSTLHKIFSLEFSNKQELKIYVDDFGLFKAYPKFYDSFFLWFTFAQEFYQDPLMKKLGINRKKMSSLGKHLEQMYMSNSWMDGKGLEKVDSFHLGSLCRMNNIAAYAILTLCGVMDGFYEPELKSIFREQHVQHFKFLSLMTQAFVQDLLSLKKELKAGEVNNIVLVWVRKGKSLQDSVNKAIKKHDQFLEKARELHNFLQKQYKNDPKVLEYLEFVLKPFSGVCQFHGSFSDRYGDVKWSIDREPNSQAMNQQSKAL